MEYHRSLAFFKAMRQDGDAHDAFNKYTSILFPELGLAKQDFIQKGIEAMKEFEGKVFSLEPGEGYATLTIQEDKRE